MRFALRVLCTAICLSVLCIHLTVLAHPGKTASDGCHYCRTNCDRWGEETNKRHCHNAPAPPSKPHAKHETSIQEISSTVTTLSRTSIVERVVDGDTLLLVDGERVRLIGVDTPETKHPTKPVEEFGKEASAFTARESEHQQVRLEFDESNAYLGHKDKYGRTLAYVYRSSDDFFLNAEIIKQGYGHAYTRYPFKYLVEFREYEKVARENKRGLWKQP